MIHLQNEGGGAHGIGGDGTNGAGGCYVNGHGGAKAKIRQGFMFKETFWFKIL